MTEQTKLDTLAQRIEQYSQHIEGEIQEFKDTHEHFLQLIEHSGVNDETADPILLGPGLLARVRQWYAFARKEAYAIAGKNRDLQKYYLAVAEQGKANQFELVRLGSYNEKMSSGTDAKEVARRVGGRLEEKAAYFEGEYLRWTGAGDAYESVGNSIKDMYELAFYEWKLAKAQ